MDSLIIDFSELSLTNNNNFNDEINEFMNIDINHPEKFLYPNSIIYGFKKIGDNENNFFYIGSSINFYTRFTSHLKLSKKENTKLYKYIDKIVLWLLILYFYHYKEIFQLYIFLHYSIHLFYQYDYIILYFLFLIVINVH